MTTRIPHDAYKQKIIAQLQSSITHDSDFYALLIGATFLALGAIFTDSVPLLIASMIVAPLANPILALGLGVARYDWRMVFRALGILLAACCIVLTISFVATILFDSERAPDTYISFSSNHYVAVGVAVVAGTIGAYGLVKPKVASAVVGVAIAVSLLPPLVATGVGLVPGGKTAGDDALVLFLLNVVGIFVASVVTFWLLGMQHTRPKPDYVAPSKRRATLITK